MSSPEVKSGCFLGVRKACISTDLLGGGGRGFSGEADRGCGSRTVWLAGGRRAGMPEVDVIDLLGDSNSDLEPASMISIL